MVSDSATSLVFIWFLLVMGSLATLILAARFLGTTVRRHRKRPWWRADNQDWRKWH